jgi:hypothetical protein
MIQMKKLLFHIDHFAMNLAITVPLSFKLHIMQSNEDSFQWRTDERKWLKRNARDPANSDVELNGFHFHCKFDEVDECADVELMVDDPWNALQYRTSMQLTSFLAESI